MASVFLHLLENPEFYSLIFQVLERPGKYAAFWKVLEIKAYGPAKSWKMKILIVDELTGGSK